MWMTLTMTITMTMTMTNASVVKEKVKLTHWVRSSWDYELRSRSENRHWRSFIFVWQTSWRSSAVFASKHAYLASTTTEVVVEGLGNKSTSAEEVVVLREVYIIKTFRSKENIIILRGQESNVEDSSQRDQPGWGSNRSTGTLRDLTLPQKVLEPVSRCLPILSVFYRST